MILNSTLCSDNPAVRPKLLSPLTLAFVGDSVFDLLIRERLVSIANRPVKELHTLSTDRVRASAQARAARFVFDMLDEEESAIYTRGRNAHTSHTPKNANDGDYHAATGLEALFGYLYLSGKTQRIAYLFDKICEEYEHES